MKADIRFHGRGQVSRGSFHLFAGFANFCEVFRTGPLRWRLHLIIGEPNDTVTDATLPWPPNRRVIDAGTVTLTTIATERAGNARDVNFDPLVLPEGIEPSDDPLLSARSSVYAASYRLRTGEAKSPSAVQVGEVS